MSHDPADTMALKDKKRLDDLAFVENQLKAMHKSRENYDPETDPIFGPGGTAFDAKEWARDMINKKENEEAEAAIKRVHKLTMFHYLYRMMKSDLKDKFGIKEKADRPKVHTAEEIREIEANMEELGRRLDELARGITLQRDTRGDEDETLSTLTTLAQRKQEEAPMWTRQWGNKDKRPESQTKY